MDPSSLNGLSNSTLIAVLVINIGQSLLQGFQLFINSQDKAKENELAFLREEVKTLPT